MSYIFSPSIYHFRLNLQDSMHAYLKCCTVVWFNQLYWYPHFHFGTIAEWQEQTTN